MYKKALLVALERSLGIVSTACKSAGISRDTFYRYYNEDPEFKAKVDDVQEIAVDFSESKLHELINGVTLGKQKGDEKKIYKTPPNVTAVIFHLKTKGKKRGYVERQEITGPDGAPVHITGMQFFPLDADKIRADREPDEGGENVGE